MENTSSCEELLHTMGNFPRTQKGDTMYEKRRPRGKIGIFAVVLFVSAMLSGCTQQGTPEPGEQPGNPQYSTPLDAIPLQLEGFPDPISASFDSTEPLDGVQIPGGYAGREWVADKKFVVALVMDFESTENASQKLAEAKPGKAVPINLGDEGYKAEDQLADNPLGFRLIMWRRDGFLAIVGGGILDVSETVVSEQVLMDLANNIDHAISNRAQPTGNLSFSLQEKTLSFTPASFGKASPTLVPSANSHLGKGRIYGVAQGRKAISSFHSPLGGKSVPVDLDLLLDGQPNGTLSLRFDVFVYPGDEWCDELDVRIYITDIHLGSLEDGDDALFRDGGDPIVGGTIDIEFCCCGTTNIRSTRFRTGMLIVNGLHENEHLRDALKNPKYEKFIAKVGRYKQCKDTVPIVNYDLLVRDSDQDDIKELLETILRVIESAKPGLGNASENLRNLLQDQEVDTSGEGVGFTAVREIDGHDLGEAHPKPEDPPIALSWNENKKTGDCECIPPPQDDQAYVVTDELPDLVVTGIDPLTEEIYVGEPATFVVHVAKKGKKSVNAEVTLRIDGSLMRSTWSVPLGEGDNNGIVSITMKFPSAKVYTVSAVVDPKGAVPESNEENNETPPIKVKVLAKPSDNSWSDWGKVYTRSQSAFSEPIENIQDVPIGGWSSILDVKILAMISVVLFSIFLSGPEEENRRIDDIRTKNESS